MLTSPLFVDARAPTRHACRENEVNTFAVSQQVVAGKRMERKEEA